MKRLLALFFLSLLLVTAAHAAKAPNYSSNASRIESLISLYNKGLAREGYGTYEDALYAYNSMLSRCDKILNSRSVDEETAKLFLPYYIAAAYRKGIVTNRYIEGSVIKLYRQLQLYEDADKWVQQVLTTVANLAFDKNFGIKPSQFAPLYYSKAYNRAGWAFAMLNGSSWKRYLIYPPSDTMNMIDKCAMDLEKMLSFYGFSYSKRPDLQSFARDYVNSLPQDSSEYRTLQLCHVATDSETIYKRLARLLDLSVIKTLDYYNDWGTKSAMEKGKSVFSFEEFIKPESKEYIKVISTFLSKLAPK